MVFLRKIFILQLVGLVLTYNFTDCDFEKIRKDYNTVIFTDLKSYMNGYKCIHCNFDSCENQPDCLTKIESLTFYLIPRCKSVAKETFTMKTNATLSQGCPGYSGMQINNTQAMKKRKKREDTIHECQKIVSNLIGLWSRFSRF